MQLLQTLEVDAWVRNREKGSVAWRVPLQTPREAANDRTARVFKNTNRGENREEM